MDQVRLPRSRWPTDRGRRSLTPARPRPAHRGSIWRRSRNTRRRSAAPSPRFRHGRAAAAAVAAPVVRGACRCSGSQQLYFSRAGGRHGLGRAAAQATRGGRPQACAWPAAPARPPRLSPSLTAHAPPAAARGHHRAPLHGHRRERRARGRTPRVTRMPCTRRRVHRHDCSRRHARVGTWRARARSRKPFRLFVRRRRLVRADGGQARDFNRRLFAKLVKRFGVRPDQSEEPLRR
jgi:hypothetical protein